MQHQQNHIRIISGRWRGRRVSFPNIQGLRPTPDRVRETLFNWLRPYIVGANCLDLFAGSGALSFEALSRGASYVCAVEQNLVVGASLREAARTLAVDESTLTLVSEEGLSWLNHKAVTPFDIVFLDPPYALGLLPSCLQLLQEKGWLKNQSLVYIENNAPFAPEWFPALGWQVLNAKQAGQVYYGLALRKK